MKYLVVLIFSISATVAEAQPEKRGKVIMPQKTFNFNKRLNLAGKGILGGQQGEISCGVGNPSVVHTGRGVCTLLFSTHETVLAQNTTSPGLQPKLNRHDFNMNMNSCNEAFEFARQDCYLESYSSESVDVKITELRVAQAAQMVSIEALISKKYAEIAEDPHFKQYIEGKINEILKARGLQ